MKFLIFFFFVAIIAIIFELSNHKLFEWEGQLIFSGDKKKNNVIFYADGFIVLGYINIGFFSAKDNLFLVVIRKKNNVVFIVVGFIVLG